MSPHAKVKVPDGNGSESLLTCPFQETLCSSYQTHFRELFISRQERVTWLFYLLSQTAWKSSKRLARRLYSPLPLNTFKTGWITPPRPPYASFIHERVTLWLGWVAMINMHLHPVSGRNLAATYAGIRFSFDLVFSSDCIFCTYYLYLPLTYITKPISLFTLCCCYKRGQPSDLCHTVPHWISEETT